jgi:hypothetical protein
MKKITIFCFLLVAMAGCEKTEDVTNSTEIRLTSLTTLEDNIPITVYFTYDEQGRISSASSDLDPQTSIAKADVSYSGDEMTISYGSNPTGIQKQIKYTLDASGKPMKRIESMLEIEVLTDQETRHYRYDTTRYEYDANGLLSHASGSKYDSTSISAATIYSSAKRESSQSEYINTNNNLTELNILSSYSLDSDGFITNGSSENKFLFGYDKSYANKMDFKNALLLTDLGVIVNFPYPLNKGYTNFPNHVTETMVHKDEAGTVTFSKEFSATLNLTFDTNGLVKTLNNESENPYTVTLNYNK